MALAVNKRYQQGFITSVVSRRHIRVYQLGWYLDSGMCRNEEILKFIVSEYHSL